MPQEEKKVIMYDSPEAAQPVLLTLPDGKLYGNGWVSTNRRFYPIESQARSDSATHIKCDCGDIIPVGRYCEVCHSKKLREKYFKMPYKEWGGATYVTLFGDDRFFRDEDELREYCYDNEILPESLMLVICEPNYLNEVEGDYWVDIMPEDSDGDLPEEVESALLNLNEVIKKQAPISWSAGQYRTSVNNTVHVSDLEFEYGNG